jgi:hypothetical protein
MNVQMWTAIREYVAAEIELSHVRRNRERVRCAAYIDNRDIQLKASDERIAELEAQSTRMDSEVRRLFDSSSGDSR